MPDFFAHSDCRAALPHTTANLWPLVGNVVVYEPVRDSLRLGRLIDGHQVHGEALVFLRCQIEEEQDW